MLRIWPATLSWVKSPSVPTISRMKRHGIGDANGIAAKGTQAQRPEFRVAQHDGFCVPHFRPVKRRVLTK
jgi:hypothetical protein